MLRVLLPVLLLAVGLVLSVVSERPLPRADLVVNNGSDISTLDLQRMSWSMDLRGARVLFEGLVANDQFTWGFDIKPGVAERWELSDDALTYTFHLRENARWSNGEPLTAHDFVFSWRRALLPDLAADYVALFQLIEGSVEFYDWRTEALAEFATQWSGSDDASERAQAARDLWAMTEAKFDEMVGVHALDDRTLEVRVVRPVPYFLDLCAFATFFPVYPPLVSQYDQLDTKTGRMIAEAGWTKPPELVSNGPFRLTRWRFKRDMRFEKNEYWWNADSVAIDSMSLVSISDPNAQVLAFQTGAVEFLADVTAAYRREMYAKKRSFYDEHRSKYESLLAAGYDQYEIDRRLPDDPRKHAHFVPAFGTYWFNFNCKPKLPDGRPNPFADARVRRAFAMAIDKQAIVEEVRGFGEPTANTLIPRDSIGGYTSPKGLKCMSDAATAQERQAIASEARALLAEAGYPDPSQFITVELLFNKDSGHDLIAQAIAKNWNKYLGVPTRLMQREIKVFRDDLKNTNFMTSRAGWYGDYGDPTTFLDLSRKDDGNNDRKYHTAEFEGLLDEANLETDPAKRMALLSRAETIIMERDLPMVPLFHYVHTYMFDASKLGGPNAHPRTKQWMGGFDILGDGKGPDVAPTMPLRPILQSLMQLDGAAS